MATNALERNTGNAANPPIHLAGHAKTRARYRGVMGPGIAIERIEDSRKLGQQFLIGAFKTTAATKHLWKKVPLFIEHNPS
jgi:hypothetical protein